MSDLISPDFITLQRHSLRLQDSNYFISFGVPMGQNISMNNAPNAINAAGSFEGPNDESITFTVYNKRLEVSNVLMDTAFSEHIENIEITRENLALMQGALFTEAKSLTREFGYKVLQNNIQTFSSLNYFYCGDVILSQALVSSFVEFEREFYSFNFNITASAKLEDGNLTIPADDHLVNSLLFNEMASTIDFRVERG